MSVKRKMNIIMCIKFQDVHMGHVYNGIGTITELCTNSGLKSVALLDCKMALAAALISP